MAQNSKIEWCDRTWNFLRGCSRISRGCGDGTGGGCYAEAIARRFSGAGLPYEGTISERGKWNGNITFHEDKLLEALKWKKPQRVFVNSMSDLFHENVKDEWIDKAFAVMALTPHITYQILTKRPDRMAEYLSDVRIKQNLYDAIHYGDNDQLERRSHELYTNIEYRKNWPLPNVHLGVSVEDQKTADERIPHLLETPAVVRFLSVEPLLGPVDLTKYLGGQNVTKEERRNNLSMGSSGVISDRLAGESMERRETSGTQSRKISNGAQNVEREAGSRYGSPSGISTLSRTNTGRDGDKPQEWEQNGQPPLQFGGDNSLRKCSTRLESVESEPEIAESKWRSEFDGKTFGYGCNEDSTSLQHRRCDTETNSGRIRGGVSDNIRDCEGKITQDSRRPDGGLYPSAAGASGSQSLRAIHLVIVGGESGPNRRIAKLEWIESIVEQCKGADVPVFVKQIELNGRVEKDIDKFPKHLQIREFPQ